MALVVICLSRCFSIVFTKKIPGKASIVAPRESCWRENSGAKRMKIPETLRLTQKRDSQSVTMSKVSDILANMFSRTPKSPSGSNLMGAKGVLKTDAGPMSPRSDEEIAEAAVEESISFPSIPPTPSMELVRQESQSSSVETPQLPVAGSSRGGEKNNQLGVAQVNNSQACNVFQFTNVNNLHIGSVFNITTETGGRISPRRDGERVYRKTHSIDAMMRSQEKLEHEHIEIIATHLGEEWRNVARDLGYSQGQIDQLLEDNHICGVKEVIYQMILGWTQEDTTATLGRITEILWRRRPHQQVVYHLKEYWKRANRTKSRRQSEVSADSTD